LAVLGRRVFDLDTAGIKWYPGGVNAPHFAALLSVIHEEELYRLRHRLLKHKNEPAYTECAEFLTSEIAKREAENESGAKTI
jgi:hypothetical protein